MGRVAELEAGIFEGEAARNFEITSDRGYRARFTTVGARLMALHYPDGFDIVQGPERPEDIPDSDIYAGAICGRFANRIDEGKFTLDGKAFELGINLPPHHLHGGAQGFHRRIWTAEIEGDALSFSLSSPNREEGYPGKLKARAVYRFDEDRLSCELEATTTRPTIINLTNHVYWNLSGSETVSDHLLQISAQAFTPTDHLLIPTGAVSFVSRTEFDFREFAPLDDAFDAEAGFDINFCLEGVRSELHHAASISAGGRELELFTTEPGVQLYTAGHHGPPLKGKKGEMLKRFGSIALEPQNWPDAPNHENFPSAVLRPGETYRHRIEWRFGAG